MFFQNQKFFIKKEENKKKVYSPVFKCILLSELYIRFDFEFDVDRSKTKDQPPSA